MISSCHSAAPAKLNLYLEITGKRADGYHLLDSLVGFTVFGDHVHVTPSDTMQLTLEGPFAKPLLSDNNLVMRAALALKNHTGCTQNAHITLHKHIPVGAGLGGGSSDAAATLLTLMRAWNVTLNPHELDALALTLGSDVPVCLRRNFAHIQGIGEQITPVVCSQRIQKLGVLLVNPRVPLLTADVYKKFSGAFSPPTMLPDVVDWEDITNHRNGLEAPAVALQSVIVNILSALASTKNCKLARMSGSGATCFGLYDTMVAATHASEALINEHPTWWVQATTWYHE